MHNNSVVWRWSVVLKKKGQYLWHLSAYRQPAVFNSTLADLYEIHGYADKRQEGK